MEDTNWAFINNTTNQVNELECPWGETSLAQGLETFLPDKIRACFEAIILLNDWSPNDTVLAVSEDEDIMAYHQYVNENIAPYSFISNESRKTLIDKLQKEFDDDIDIKLDLSEIFDSAQAGLDYSDTASSDNESLDNESPDNASDIEEFTVSSDDSDGSDD